MNKKSFFGQILPQKTDQSFNQYQYHCITIQNHCIKIQKYKSSWKIEGWRDVVGMLSYNHRKGNSKRFPDRNQTDARIAPLPTVHPYGHTANGRGRWIWKRERNTTTCTLKTEWTEIASIQGRSKLDHDAATGQKKPLAHGHKRQRRDTGRTGLDHNRQLWHRSLRGMMGTMGKVQTHAWTA